MGSKHSFPRTTNFEEVQRAITSNTHLIINTLSFDKQQCLIQSTVKAADETDVINKLVGSSYSNPLKYIKVIVYGINSTDTSAFIKQAQLISFGFEETYVYSGGMFEWLLLQDIYGDALFSTTSSELDILAFAKSCDPNRH
jgi:hypothetical protein